MSKLNICSHYSYMKTITKGKNMNNLKKVGLTALAGSLAAISANAAEMTVSGATMLTYTSEHSNEVTGNPLGMKTNLGFTASGEVNGYTVSYMQTSMDQFAGMSSARLSVDMGDMGTLAFDQGSGSGLATIDDKTPTAAEEIWDGLDEAVAKEANGRVGTAGSSGVFNYVNTFAGVKFNGAMRTGAGVKSGDGASSGAAAFPSPSTSNSIQTTPTGNVSPASPTTRVTFPSTGEGISTVALSVITERIGSSSLTMSPTATIHSTTSPSTTPSPISGILNANVPIFIPPVFSLLLQLFVLDLGYNPIL